ncbi:hypothetical protein ACFWOJ_37240 [Streptomyces sp. NPDC058439]|uniref:hypothetical protein n=1 Tax=Streptomyces sp. NPDC058439 TaxID=3346500 RepID=UPI003667B18C
MLVQSPPADPALPEVRRFIAVSRARPQIRAPAAHQLLRVGHRPQQEFDEFAPRAGAASTVPV